MFEPASTAALVDLTDGELVRRFRRGDDEALEALLSRHREALYRYCCHLVSNREDAEDICQESLARAVARVDTLETGSAFRSWLFRIARNLSVDAFRTRRRTCPLPDEEVIPAPLHVESPQDRVETGEEYQTVAQALARLAKSHQRVLMLREVEGLSYADIAERLDVSQSAVETLLFRARRRLREEYGKKGSVLSGVALLSGVQELVLRLGAPLAGGPPVAAKVAITAAMVGAVVAAPRAFPTGYPAAKHHSPAHLAALRRPLIPGHAPAHLTRETRVAVAIPRLPAIRSAGPLTGVREPAPAPIAGSGRESAVTIYTWVRPATPVRLSFSSFLSQGGVRHGAVARRHAARHHRAPVPSYHVIGAPAAGYRVARVHLAAGPGVSTGLQTTARARRASDAPAPGTGVAAAAGQPPSPQVGITSRESVLARPIPAGVPDAAVARVYPPSSSGGSRATVPGAGTYSTGWSTPARLAVDPPRGTTPPNPPVVSRTQASGVPESAGTSGPPPVQVSPRTVPVSGPAPRDPGPSTRPVVPPQPAPVTGRAVVAPVPGAPAGSPVGAPPSRGVPAGSQPPPVTFPPPDRGTRP